MTTDEAFKQLASVPRQNVLAEASRLVERVLKQSHGFILMVFEFGDTNKEKYGKCEYISNAERKDIVALFKEQAKGIEEKLG
jgi:hypothetical protein